MARKPIKGRKGGGSNATTPVESPDSIQSTARAKILISLGEGEFAGGLDGTNIYLDGTPIKNSDGTSNFTGVTWEYRPGTQAQDYIQGMPNVENEITVNTELKSDTPWVRSVTNTQLSATRIRLGWPSLQRQADNGDVGGYRIEYAIDVSTDGGAYSTLLNTAIDGKTTTLYERSHRINLPKATTGWQIRSRRITANANSGRIADKMNVEAISEVIDAKLRYPNTALLYIEFDATQFQNIPVISCEPKGRIIRVPTTYDPVTRTYSGIWDGTFKWAYTNNPAWVFYDIVLADRFGLGHRIEASQVDKWELYRIGQYCDQLVPDGRGGSGTEPRFTCDIYIQSQAEAFTVLRDLAAIFRGMTYWGNNQLCALADMPRDVDYIFTRASVIDGRFTYGGGSEKKRYTTAMVSWSDPTNNFQDAIEAVSDNDLVRRYGVNQLDMTAIGCIRQTEANRRGRWALLTNSKDRTVNFNVGLDGAIPLPGHIIGVADEMLSGRKMGGRISSVSGRNITLDRVADVKIGDRLLVNLPNGVAQGRTVQALNGRVVTVTTTYSEVPAAESVWSIDADDLAIQQYRVTGISDNDDNTYSISAVQHDPDKYERIDTGARIDERPISVIPPGVQPPPTNVVIDSFSALSQGLAVTTLRVTWEPTQANDARAFAEYQLLVTATFEEQTAAIDQKMTAVVDADGASATYSLRAGLNYKGQFVSAGMVIGAEFINGVAKSSIGFNADQFILLSGSTGNVFSPFAVVNGQVFMNDAFIAKASIGRGKITDTLESDNYAQGLSGLKLDFKNGNAEFNNVTIRGTVYATAGKFSGTIESNDGYFGGTVYARKIIGDVVQGTHLKGYITSTGLVTGTVTERVPSGVLWSVFSFDSADFDRTLIINGDVTWGNIYSGNDLGVLINGVAVLNFVTGGASTPASTVGGVSFNIPATSIGGRDVLSIKYNNFGGGSSNVPPTFNATVLVCKKGSGGVRVGPNNVAT
uniref:TipJ family phage tail tip protein n=1 Tax=Yersinia proxima TaxID=2890316 RepID=UPI001D12EC19|nr:DUF1983 domain-containing protein [Yersinia proxima]